MADNPVSQSSSQKQDMSASKSTHDKTSTEFSSAGTTAGNRAQNHQSHLSQQNAAAAASEGLSSQMIVTSDDVNYLIYRYLQESGFVHSAFSFAHESMLGRTGLRSSDKSVPPGALITFLQKGLQYVGIEESLVKTTTKQQSQRPTPLPDKSENANSAASAASAGTIFSLLSPATMTAITRSNPPIQLNVPPATAVAALKARLEAEAAKTRQTTGANHVARSAAPALLTATTAASANPSSSLTPTSTINQQQSLQTATPLDTSEVPASAPLMESEAKFNGNLSINDTTTLEDAEANVSLARQALMAQAAVAHAAAAMSQLQQDMGSHIQQQHQQEQQSIQTQQPVTAVNAVAAAAAQIAQQQVAAASADIIALQQQQQQHQGAAAALAIAAAASINRNNSSSLSSAPLTPQTTRKRPVSGSNLPIAGGANSTNKQQRISRQQQSQKRRKSRAASEDAVSVASAISDVSESQQPTQQQLQQNAQMPRIQKATDDVTPKRRRLPTAHGKQSLSTTDAQKALFAAAASMSGPTPMDTVDKVENWFDQKNLLLHQQRQQQDALKGQKLSSVPALPLHRGNQKNGEVDHSNGDIKSAESTNTINPTLSQVVNDSQINGSDHVDGNAQAQVDEIGKEPFSDLTSSTVPHVGENDVPDIPDPEDLETEAAKSEVLQLQMHESEVFMCAWNPVYTNLIATGSGDASARIWEMLGSNAKAGLGAVKLLPHGTDPRDKKNKDVTTLEWSSDGEYLATGSYDGVARVWGRNGALLITLRKHTGPIFSLKWNKKGNYILSGSYDTTTIVWDVTGRKPDHVVQQFTDHKAPALDVDWRDNNTFASCSTDKTVHIYRIGDDRPLRIYHGHTDEVNAVKWDPSRVYLASCSDDCTAKVWDFESESTSPLYTFDSHSQEIYTVKWSPSGPGTTNTSKQCLLATASFDGTVRLWSIQDGSCFRIFKRHRESVYSVAFSPSGDYLASGSLAGQMYIWNIEDGRHVKSYKGTGDIFEVAWNREGVRVAACFSSNVVAVIDFDRKQIQSQQRRPLVQR